MILRLVDRRAKPDPLDLVVSQLNLFEDLVKELGCPHWVFDLVLIDDEAMVQLNEQYRGKEGVTDVLSFSYLMEVAPGPCHLNGGCSGAYHDLWVDPLSDPGSESEQQQIGEIIVAPSFVSNRCRQRQWSVKNEFPLLVVHGALHLLGWDHQTEDETRGMRDLEKEFLAVCGLPHPLQPEERLNG